LEFWRANPLAFARIRNSLLRRIPVMFARSKSKSRNRPRPDRLGFEQLEDRSLLAGNVAAFFSGSMLVIRGDAAGNQVLVERTSASQVTLSSLDGTTTINGSAGPVVLNGFTSSFSLAAGDGDDHFRVSGVGNGSFVVPGVAQINMGNGNDTLEMSRFHVGRNLVLHAGAGNDEVDLRRSSIRMAVLVGGPDFDTLNSFGNQFLRTPVIVQFEGRTAVDTPLTPPADNEPPTISDVANATTSLNTAAGPFDITVGDDLTAAGSLALSATSSNTTLVPNANIQLGGSGSARTVLVTPAAGASGTSTITLTVTDAGGLTATDTFTVTVNPQANTAPTIGAVADASVNNNAQLGPVNVTISDPETAAAALQLAATSSNQAVIANSGIQLGGSGGTRTVLITPVGGASGTSTITLTVTDGANDTATETFVVTVNAAPTIANVADQTIAEDTATGSLAVTLADDFTAAGSLNLAATSSNTTLVPNANIQLGGSGSARTVVVTPVGNATGTSTITLTATDQGGLTATETFTVTVNPANDLPTIDPVADVTTNLNTQAGPIAVTIGDQETPAASLTLAGTSSNQAVVSNSGIQLGGSGAARTVLITPVAGATGTATITLTVTDAANGTATETFVVTVNGAPTISDVANQTVAEDTATGSLAVTVGDDLTAAGSLVLSATSSDTAVVPNANIQLGGSGTARTVIVTPAANATGTSTITVTVTDEAGLTATDTFTVTVTPANDPPVATPDLFTVVEDSGVTVTGNLLTNDNDGGDGGSLTITALSTGTVGTPFVGLSGTFTINANGSITFDLDDTIAAIDALMAGQELFEELQYTVSDGTDTSIGTVRIRIQGAAG
jgi:VCBS repeat-containing protein